MKPPSMLQVICTSRLGYARPSLGMHEWRTSAEISTMEPDESPGVAAGCERCMRAAQRLLIGSLGPSCRCSPEVHGRRESQADCPLEGKPETTDASGCSIAQTFQRLVMLVSLQPDIVHACHLVRRTCPRSQSYLHRSEVERRSAGRVQFDDKTCWSWSPCVPKLISRRDPQHSP